MIKIVYALYRRPNLSRKQFVDHWRNVHGRMVVDNKDVLRLCRYVQTEPIEHEYSELIQKLRTHQTRLPDGLAELCWANDEDFRWAFTDPEARRVQRSLREDEQTFLDTATGQIWIGTEHRMI